MSEWEKRYICNRIGATRILIFIRWQDTHSSIFFFFFIFIIASVSDISTFPSFASRFLFFFFLHVRLLAHRHYYCLIMVMGKRHIYIHSYTHV